MDGILDQEFTGVVCGDGPERAALAKEPGVPIEIIERTPSAGLWLGQIDEGEMGFTYAELDQYLSSGPEAVAPSLAVKIERLVRASEHIIDREDLVGPVNVLAPAPVTNAEFARALAAVTGRRQFLRVPRWALRLVMGEIAGSMVEGDPDLRPAKLSATGFRFLCPDIMSALRHELSLGAIVQQADA